MTALDALLADAHDLAQWRVVRDVDLPTGYRLALPEVERVTELDVDDLLHRFHCDAYCRPGLHRHHVFGSRVVGRDAHAAPVFLVVPEHADDVDSRLPVWQVAVWTFVPHRPAVPTSVTRLVGDWDRWHALRLDHPVTGPIRADHPFDDGGHTGVLRLAQEVADRLAEVVRQAMEATCST